MSVVSQSALVPYSAAQMYQLVNDVQSYPEFLPWCVDCEIHHKTDEEQKASLKFAKGALKVSFTTVNQLTANERIEMHLVEGPFHHLKGIWEFVPIAEDASKVTLLMEFELANPILKATLGPLFNQISDRLVSDFVKRAEQVYGSGTV